MANRHFGLDVRVLAVGGIETKAVYESIDYKETATVKETQAAQDTGPNRRVLGYDFSVTLGKFVEGDADWLTEYCRTNREDCNLVFQLSQPGSGPNGTLWKTITLNNCIVNSIGLNTGTDATKETIEFQRGTSDPVIA